MPAHSKQNRFVLALARPFLWVFWLSWAAYLVVAHALLHHTCRKQILNREFPASRPNFIYCGWHHTIVPYMVAFSRFDRPMMQLTNDAWYMWPVHWFVQRVGISPLIPLNSSRLGKEAVGWVVQHLKEGFSTIVTPDGPSGPPKVLKRGVLLMALKSGVPILPIRTEAKWAWVWYWSWDQKRVPLPFSKVVVSYGEPIYVTRETLDDAEEKLILALG